MALDFISCIGSNVSLTAAKKLEMLEDFALASGYSLTDEAGNPTEETKKDFANRMIKQFIINRVNSYRKSKAEKVITFEELSLE